MKLLLLALVLATTGCTTVVPVVAKFPEPPGTLVQEPCPTLKLLDAAPTLSGVATTVTNNYTEYYQCAAKLSAWQRWYGEQKALYERLK